jgi:hypothetical protein
MDTRKATAWKNWLIKPIILANMPIFERKNSPRRFIHAFAGIFLPLADADQLPDAKTMHNLAKRPILYPI